MRRCAVLLSSTAALACVATAIPLTGDCAALATMLPFGVLAAVLAFGRYPGEERIAALRQELARPRLSADTEAEVPRAALAVRGRMAALLGGLCLAKRPPPSAA